MSSRTQFENLGFFLLPEFYVKLNFSDDGVDGTKGKAGSTPRNLSARPLSASTMVIQWDEPEQQTGLVTVSLIFLVLPTLEDI